MNLWLEILRLPIEISEDLFRLAGEKEGYEQIAAIFLDTADNEKEHAKVLSKLLQGGEVEITGAFPAGIIGDAKAKPYSCCGWGEVRKHQVVPWFCMWAARHPGNVRHASTKELTSKSSMRNTKW